MCGENYWLVFSQQNLHSRHTAIAADAGGFFTQIQFEVLTLKRVYAI
jgi:hypothetical protein